MDVNYKRYFLKTKEAEAILNQASQKLKLHFDRVFNKGVELELVETDFGEMFLVKDRPLLVEIEGKIFPTLVFEEVFASLPKVVVDMGAVPHVCNGADVMAPGIVRFEGEFGEGDVVFVVDEKHGKKIAVGQAVCSIEAAKKISKGVVVENFHFVGDKIWGLMKKLDTL